MLTVYSVGASGRRVVEQGSRESCLAFLAHATGGRFQVEFRGERSGTLAPDAAERFVALFCR